MRDVCAWRGTRRGGGGGGGVDVLLHLGDVWKGPEGEMVLGRVLRPLGGERGWTGGKHARGWWWKARRAKNSNILAHAFQEYSGGGGSASTRHSDYSENIAKLGNDSRRDKTTHAEETGTYKTIDRSDK
ncbi:hypothetical protein B0H14DRAFT_2566425 [Mycena olivaceomarginata]|nr:hypothetical protein B0H14DRAFT_2566425 [Mycena olivaceomarginata]